MKISKHVVTISLAAVGLFISASALALPGFGDDAPQSTIDVCVAQIADQANYENATRVRHVVESKQRRISGHILKIETTVFGVDGEEIIREYATTCAVNDRHETRLFKIQEKGTHA